MTTISFRCQKIRDIHSKIRDAKATGNAAGDFGGGGNGGGDDDLDEGDEDEEDDIEVDYIFGVTQALSSK